jgi:hypothetical protein
MPNSTATLVASTQAKASAVPLTGAELLRVIQGGVSKQATISNIASFITATGVQAQDDLLDSIAALTFGADSYIYGTGTDTAAVGTISSVGRTLVAQTTQALARTTGLGMSANGSSLVSAADYAAMKVLLSLTIGTDVQAWDAQLDTWSGVTPGTGVATALAVNVGSAGAFVTFNGALGTPSSGTLTNATGLPVASGISGLGTGIATALAVNTGSAGAPVLFNGALGTPSSGTLTSCTGLPVASGISGFGTGVATALAVNVGSAGAFVTFNGALGTPSSGALTNCTGLTTGGVAAATLVTAADTVASNDNDTTWPTTAAIIDYAQPLDSDLTAIAALTTTAAGRSVLTIADPGVDRIVAWDDSDGAMEAIALADLTNEASPATGDYLLIYGAEGDLRRADWSTLPGAGGGISNVSEDTSPSLGGALDGDGFDVIDIGVLTLREQAAAEADVAGLGQIWVQTATPNLLMFTDDAGTDFQVATLTGTETLSNKTLTAPALGTPASGALSNCTAYPQSALTGLGSGVSTFLGTPSYTNLAAALTGSVLKTAGKETMWVPAAAMWARSTNGAALVNRELTTGGDIMVRGWGFDTTTEEAVQFYIGPPKSWNLGTITFQPVWTNTGGASTETVSWGLSVGAYTDSDAIDSTDLGTEVRVADTWLAQNDIHVAAESGAVTVGNTPIDGDMLIGQIARSVANDNMAGDAELLGCWIYFTTSVTNDA